MIARQIAAGVLLWLGVALVVASCVGVLAYRSAYDRLHFTSPLNLGAICIAISVVIHEDFSLVGNKALLVAAFLLAAGPVLAHATARAARHAERGDWRIGRDEEIEVEER